MRWIRFNYDGKATYGILEDETVKVVRGDPFNGYEESGETRAFEDVKLLVPVVPKVFYAAGLNYVDHIMEHAAKSGREPNIPPEALSSGIPPYSISANSMVSSVEARVSNCVCS